MSVCIYRHTYTYIYIYIYKMCVCVCNCWVLRWIWVDSAKQFSSVSLLIYTLPLVKVLFSTSLPTPGIARLFHFSHYGTWTVVSFCISVKINDIIFSGHLCVSVKCLSFAHFSFWLFITFLLICRVSQYFLVSKIYVIYVCCKYNNLSLCGLHFQSIKWFLLSSSLQADSLPAEPPGKPLMLSPFGVVFFPIPVCRCFCLWRQFSCCSPIHCT